MPKIQTILAPSDLSDLSIAGVRYGLELAQWQASEVLVYHAVTVEETPFPQGNEAWVASQTDMPRIKKLLDQRRKQLDQFLCSNLGALVERTVVRQEVGIGTPYKVILDLARDQSIDLIVMSTHGRTGLAHMLMGSVTERVLRRAPCPVLAVPLENTGKKRRRKL